MSELEVTPDGKLVLNYTENFFVIGYATGWRLEMRGWIELDRPGEKT